MEKDTLRRHVYDEIHSQFETKLREAKRQKSQIEEELESLSEKWRSERRRLNSEIDRLESALAEAKDTRKKANSKGGKNTDADEITKLQAASEEKLKKASQEWLKERATLESEVSRLQLGLADLIERSNNPLRATQAVREELEARLKEALRIKKQREDELIAAQREWEQEKIRLAAEMVKLRRSLEGKPAKTKVLEEGREEELQKRLKELTESNENLERRLQKSKADAEAAQKALMTEVTKLQEQLSAGQRKTESQDTLNQQLQEARKQQQLLQQQTDEGQKSLQALQAQQAAERKQLAGQLEQTRAEIGRIRTESERILRLTQSESEAAKKQLSNEIENLQKKLGALKTETKPGGEQLQEVMQHRNFLEQQVHQAEEAIRTIRAEQSVEHEQITAQLEQARTEAKEVQKDLERRLRTATQETESLRLQLTDRPAGAEGTNEQFQEVMQHRNFLQQQVSQAEEAIQSLRKEQSDERAQWTARLDRSRLEASQIIKGLELQLKKTVDQLREKSTTPLEDMSGEGLNEQLQEVMQQRHFLEQQLHEAQGAIQSIRTEQSTEREKMVAQLEQARSEMHHLELKLAETQDSVSSDVVDQLRKQYDQKLQGIVQEKTKLAEQLSLASSMLDTERSRLAAGGDEGKTGIDPRISEEVSRIEGAIQGISVLIDDPSVELSTVIRKNVERAELDAYLRGILFSLGRNKAVPS